MEEKIKKHREGKIQKAIREIRLTGGLQENPYKKDSMIWKICRKSHMNFQTGKSDLVFLEDLPEEMRFGNGASYLRQDGSAAIFHWDIKKEKGKIVSIQATGYRKHMPPRKVIKNEQKPKSGDVCVFTGVDSDLMADHKEGCWKDYDEGDMRVNETQPIHNRINSIKRGACKKCQETDKRPEAPPGYFVKYTDGNEKLSESGCKGCHWNDADYFRKKSRELEMAPLIEENNNLKQMNAAQRKTIEELEKRIYRKN
jgi:hypothetical protein